MTGSYWGERGEKRSMAMPAVKRMMAGQLCASVSGNVLRCALPAPCGPRTVCDGACWASGWRHEAKDGFPHGPARRGSPSLLLMLRAAIARDAVLVACDAVFGACD